MRPFDNIAALVEHQFRRSKVERIRNTSAKCFTDDSFRGTTKTTDYFYTDAWRLGEYRLTREEVNLDLGWSPVLTYGSQMLTDKRDNSISFNAVSGIMSDGRIGRIVLMTILVNQAIPQVLWQNAAPRLGALIELPNIFREVADQEVEELEYTRLDGGSRITGHFDLHCLPAGTPLHQDRPESPSMTRFAQERGLALSVGTQELFHKAEVTMIFPAGPLLAHALAGPADLGVLADMFDALRYRGKRGLSSLPARQSGSAEDGPTRYTLVFEGLIPAPHETKTKLVYRGGMGHGMPCQVQYTEQAIIEETESPLGSQRRLEVTTTAWVSLPGGMALSVLEILGGLALGQAVQPFEPLEPLMNHIISHAECQNDVTRIYLDTSNWTDEIVAGQMAEGSTSKLIGSDPNFPLVSRLEPVLQSAINGHLSVC